MGTNRGKEVPVGLERVRQGLATWRDRRAAGRIRRGGVFSGIKSRALTPLDPSTYLSWMKKPFSGQGRLARASCGFRGNGRRRKSMTPRPVTFDAWSERQPSPLKYQKVTINHLCPFTLRSGLNGVIEQCHNCYIVSCIDSL